MDTLFLGDCLDGLGLWSFLEPVIAFGQTTETQASTELVMAESYNGQGIFY